MNGRGWIYVETSPVLECNKATTAWWYMDKKVGIMKKQGSVLVAVMSTSHTWKLLPGRVRMCFAIFLLPNFPTACQPNTRPPAKTKARLLHPLILKRQKCFPLMNKQSTNRYVIFFFCKKNYKNKKNSQKFLEYSFVCRRHVPVSSRSNYKDQHEHSAGSFLV